MPRGRPPKAPASELLDDPALPPFQDSPEFKAAVKAAVAEAMGPAVKEALGQLAITPAAADGSGVDSKTLEIMRSLAMTIGEISDQGTGRKRYSPEELSARKTAHDECVRLIMQARADKAQPEYRVIAKIFFNEQFIEPWKMGRDKMPVANEIIWTGMPNDALVPLNDVAKAISMAYRRSVGMPDHIQIDSAPVWVTQNGLVIKGEAPAQHRAVAADPIFKDELKLPNDPTASHVRVLGSIAEPARQNVLPNQ